MTPTSRWYVVETHPHAEEKAVAHLRRQGFEIYLPRYLKRRRHARRVQTVAAPLFPRYLFVALDTAVQRWRAIKSTVGVARFLCHGDEPVPLGEGIVDDLRRREDEKGFVRLETRARFRAGEPVRILDGVFGGCLGLFEGMTDSERVAVLLDLLGRKIRIVLDAEALASA